MAEAFLALGGNVGDVRATFDRAVACCAMAPLCGSSARSGDYRTPPWGVTDQPAFVNAAIADRDDLAPPRAAGPRAGLRARASAATARASGAGAAHIDIDLLAYDDVIVDEPDLTLPHPRLFERAFVLVPLAEIAPDAHRRRRDGARWPGSTSGHRDAAAAGDRANVLRSDDAERKRRDLPAERAVCV